MKNRAIFFLNTWLSKNAPQSEPTHESTEPNPSDDLNSSKDSESDNDETETKDKSNDTKSPQTHYSRGQYFWIKEQASKDNDWSNAETVKIMDEEITPSTP